MAIASKRGTRLRVWLATALLAVLAGCAVPGQPSPFQGSSAPNPAAAPHPVFATELAGPATYLAPMPTAVVVLKPGDMARNRAFCAAFVGMLPTAQAVRAASVAAPNLVLTRWLVQVPDMPAERATDCDFLVGAYDYARAARLLGSLRLTEGQASGPGPFLLMVVPDAAGLHVAGLDGSAYAETDFGGFVTAWGTALRETEQRVGDQPDQPGLVRSVFDLVGAILRGIVGIAGGVISGVLTAL